LLRKNVERRLIQHYPSDSIFYRSVYRHALLPQCMPRVRPAPYAAPTGPITGSFFPVT
jgi:hypothetical protein